MKKGEKTHVLPEPIDQDGPCRLFVYPHGDPEIDPASFSVNVWRVPYAQLAEQREEEKKTHGMLLRGIVTMYAVVWNGEGWNLELNPVPDLDMHAVFRFNPPLKEI